MLLSDHEIRDALTVGLIQIDPLDETLIQPASIDVRLDSCFRTFNTHEYTHIDPSIEQPGLTELEEIGTGAFVLHPGEFALASTVETVTLPNDIAARCEGKSSLGRLGLMVHSTAGFIDPGFTGTITLELSNVANLPIKLWPGMKIGQLCLFQLTSPADAAYGDGATGSRYQGQQGPTASRSWEGWTTWPTL